MDNDDELLRLRHRCHKLENDYVALRLLYRILQRKVNRLQRTVNRMDTADQIAEAVALRVNTDRTLRLSRTQWVIATLLATPPAIDLVWHIANHF